MFRNGTTYDTSATIDNLDTYTKYTVRVCIQLLSGITNLDKCSEIKVSTSAAGNNIYNQSSVN